MALHFLSYCWVGSKEMSLFWPIKSSEDHLFCPAHDLTSDTNLTAKWQETTSRNFSAFAFFRAKNCTVLTIRWCKMASGFISPLTHRGRLPWLHPSSSAEIKTSNQTLGRHVILRGISCVPGLWCFRSVWSATVQRISCLFCDWGRVFDSAHTELEFIAVLVLTGTWVGKAGSQEGQEDLTPLIQLWLTQVWKNAAWRIISGIFLQNLSIKHLSQVLGVSSGMSDFTIQYKRRKRQWLSSSLCAAGVGSGAVISCQAALPRLSAGSRVGIQPHAASLNGRHVADSSSDVTTSVNKSPCRFGHSESTRAMQAAS